MHLLIDYRLARTLADRNLEDAVRQADARRLVAQANRPGSVAASFWARRLAGRTALLLVALGGRLVCYGLPAYSPLATQSECQAHAA